MSGARRYDDERFLDDLVCPPEPMEESPMSEMMKRFEQEQRKRDEESQAHEDAEERRSRNFSITPDSATGKNPKEEDY